MPRLLDMGGLGHYNAYSRPSAIFGAMPWRERRKNELQITAGHAAGGTCAGERAGAAGGLIAQRSVTWWRFMKTIYMAPWRLPRLSAGAMFEAKHPLSHDVKTTLHLPRAVATGGTSWYRWRAFDTAQNYLSI